MPLQEHDERVQVRLLQACREQKRQVQAGGQARFGHLAGAPNLLPGVLEARRGQRVVQPHGNHRAPDRRRQLPRALGSVLVAIDGGALPSAVQHTGGRLEHTLDRRVVGLHEGGHHVGQLADAGPLIAGQQLDDHVQRAQHLVGLRTLHEFEDHSGLFGLGQARQKRTVELQIQLLQLHGLRCTYGVQVPGSRFHERWLRTDRQIQALQRNLRPVGHGQFPQCRYRILKVGQVQPGYQNRMKLNSTCVLDHRGLGHRIFGGHLTFSLNRAAAIQSPIFDRRGVCAAVRAGSGPFCPWHCGVCGQVSDTPKHHPKSPLDGNFDF